MEDKTYVIKIDNTAYIGYKADEIIEIQNNSSTENPTIIPPVVDNYINADEVRF